MPGQSEVGITKACFYEPAVNRTYAEMTAHYGTPVVPARPRDPLSHREAAPSSLLRAPVWRDILDFDGNDVTAPQLAVDGEVQHGHAPDMSLDLPLGADRPDMLRAQRRLGSDQLAFVPRYPLWHIGNTTGSLSCMGLCSNQENNVSVLRAGSLLTSHRTGRRHAIERASR